MDDKELIEKFKSESTKNYAFNLLVRKYQEKAYWHIRKMVIDHDDANDLTQETFVKVWQHLDSFKGESQLYTWIYKIATNESLGFLRKKKRKFLLPIGDVSKHLLRKLESKEYISGDELSIQFQKALITLPEKQRLVFNMKYFDEMKYEEISQILDTSVGALKASYHHAVKKIEEYMKKVNV
ncbi:MAG: sigma-70 family RNA polymerase sigma factor [Thermonemataceae bacterium]|nr:sigma-70 family RNA polymerase sigma factor [Thermonemataceae bacterium]